MKIPSNKLIGLLVETESGQQLGKVSSFNLETGSQSILEYIIRPFNLVKDLIGGDLIISRGQVVSISQKKMIVEDNVIKKEKIKNKITDKIKSKVKEKIPSGAIIRNKE